MVQTRKKAPRGYLLKSHRSCGLSLPVPKTASCGFNPEPQYCGGVGRAVRISSVGRGMKDSTHQPKSPAPGPGLCGFLAAATTTVTLRPARSSGLPVGGEITRTHDVPLRFAVEPPRAHLSPGRDLVGVGTQAPFLEAARRGERGVPPRAGVGRVCFYINKLFSPDSKGICPAERQGGP